MMHGQKNIKLDSVAYYTSRLYGISYCS